MCQFVDLLICRFDNVLICRYVPFAGASLQLVPNISRGCGSYEENCNFHCYRLKLRSKPPPTPSKGGFIKLLIFNEL